MSAVNEPVTEKPPIWDGEDSASATITSHDPSVAGGPDGVPESLVADVGEPQAVGLWRLAYGALGLVALALGFLFFRVTADSSFVTWRYGHNLVEHGVWNWNSSGPPVEAYTSPLYAVLSIIPPLVGISAELFFKIVAVVVAVGFVVVVRRARLPKVQEFVLLAVALASPIFFLQLFMGLETVSFALLTGWMFAIVYRRGGLGRAGFVVAGAVALARPEGVVLAAVAIIWSLLIDRSRANRRGAAAVLAVWGLYWAVRWWYFGSFFPNVFTKETGGDEPMAIRIIQVLPVAGPIFLPILIGLALGFIAYRRATGTALWSRSAWLQDAVPVVLGLTSVGLVLGLYGESEPAMDVGHRLYWQLVFPVVLLVLSRPLQLGAGSNETESGRQRWMALGGVAVPTCAVLLWSPGTLSAGAAVGSAMVALAVVVATWRRITGAVLLAAIGLGTMVGFGNATELTSMLAYRYRLAAAHEAIGVAIGESRCASGAVAVADAGVLPYRSDRSTIDIDGPGTTAPLDETFLASQNLQLAILLSGSDDAGSAWYTPESQPVHSYVSNPRRDFWSAPAAEFAPNYHLNYWIGPQWRKCDLSKRLNQAFSESRALNDRSDTQIVADNLWNFSFLGR